MWDNAQLDWRATNLMSSYVGCEIGLMHVTRVVDSLGEFVCVLCLIECDVVVRCYCILAI